VKLEIIKGYGGTLSPASDEVAEQLTKFKSGELYEIEMKLVRNPAFLRKVFAFFNFCFEHWDGQKAYPDLDPRVMKDKMRKDLTVIAGYSDVVVDLNGNLKRVPKSLSFGQMSEEEFQGCYSALINAAIRTIFKGMDCERINTRLLEFF